MKKPDKNVLFIVVGSALLFIPFLGIVHLFDWDEINFAEAAREMIVTHDYWRPQINFQPFWEKPPLFIWLQVLSMKTFGINEFAARFPNAIIGIISLVVIYLIGKKLFIKQFGLLWTLVYAGSMLPQLYFKSGIIDPTFNLFIFCGVYFLFRRIHSLDSGEKDSTNWYTALGGTFIGLAILTKGPVALLLSGLTILIYFIARLKSTKFYIKQYIVFVIAALGVALIWFGLETLKHGSWFIHEFFDYQLNLFSAPGAGHGGPWYYHPLVLLIGCFPASILFFYIFRKSDSDSPIQRSFKLWMIILFFVVLIVFSIVKTKIVHYSSLCYFPLTFCAAYALYSFRQKKNVLPIALKILFFVVGIVFSALLIALPIIGMNISAIIPYVHDDFAKANLQADVHWSYAYTLIGIFYLLSIIITFYLIQKKNVFKAFMLLFTCTIIMVQTVLVLIAPKIELNSQNAAISFYESLKGKDVYVDVLGFNSYAQFFYTNKQNPKNKKSFNQDWLLTGQVDKPVYIVCKINNADGYIQQYHLTKIGEKNGFVFLRR
jgi:4-amino-4-deoxy-L-arabinose transferase-like glycosyltransferase